MQLRIKGVMVGMKTAFETDWLQGISLIVSQKQAFPTHLP